MYTERNTQEVRDYLYYLKFIISVIFYSSHYEICDVFIDTLIAY